MPEEPIRTTGLILEQQHGHALYRTALPNGKVVLAHLSKAMTQALTQTNIELVTGDRVMLEMTPFDFDQARITARAD